MKTNKILFLLLAIILILNGCKKKSDPPVALIGFAESTVSQTEGDQSILVLITSQLNVYSNSTITISVNLNQGITINEDITLSNTLEGNSFELSIPKGGNQCSFRITPLTDQLEEILEGTTFTITQIEGEYLEVNNNTTLDYSLNNKTCAIAYFPFDGDANESINGQINGTLFGTTPTQNRNSETNKALQFDGVDDYVNIPHSELLNFDYNQDFSISLWVEPNLNQNNLNGESNALIYKWNDQGSTAYPYCIRYFNETENKDEYTEYTISCARNDQHNVVTEVLSNTIARDNGWNHIILIKEGSNLKIYQNGILKNTETDNSSGSTQNELDIKVGARLPEHPTSDRYFTGKIDDIKFYDRALAVSEIEVLYNE